MRLTNSNIDEIEKLHAIVKQSGVPVTYNKNKWSYNTFTVYFNFDHSTYDVVNGTFLNIYRNGDLITRSERGATHNHEMYITGDYTNALLTVVCKTPSGVNRAIEIIYECIEGDLTFHSGDFGRSDILYNGRPHVATHIVNSGLEQVSISSKDSDMREFIERTLGKHPFTITFEMLTPEVIKRCNAVFDLATLTSKDVYVGIVTNNIAELNSNIGKLLDIRLINYTQSL